MHPSEPWVLCGLYSGKAAVYSYASQSLLKSFDVSELPVR
jgi:coatomer subunit beta'